MLLISFHDIFLERILAQSISQLSLPQRLFFLLNHHFSLQSLIQFILFPYLSLAVCNLFTLFRIENAKIFHVYLINLDRQCMSKHTNDILNMYILLLEFSNFLLSVFFFPTMLIMNLITYLLSVKCGIWGRLTLHILSPLALVERMFLLSKFVFQNPFRFGFL